MTAKLLYLYSVALPLRLGALYLGLKQQCPLRLRQSRTMTAKLLYLQFCSVTIAARGFAPQLETAVPATLSSFFPLAVLLYQYRDLNFFTCHFCLFVFHALFYFPFHFCWSHREGKDTKTWREFDR